MFLLDLLMDDLAKEAKEAPGWISLWVFCNVALYPVFGLAQRLGHVAEERGTFATLASIVLFFLGDMLDIVIFPRSRKDDERGAKLVRDVMLICAALGLFLPVIGFWEFGIIAWLPWVLLFFIYQQLTSTKNALPGQEQPAGEPKPSGWARLAPKELDDRQKAVRVALHLDGGIYAVSKSLARRAGRYFGKLPWVQNELAKFIRSVVIPTVAAFVFLAWRREWRWAAAAASAAVVLSVLYARLKAWHMCRLYRIACELAETGPAYETITVAGGALDVFLRGEEPVAFREHGRGWREIPRELSNRPYPTAAALGQ